MKKQMHRLLLLLTLPAMAMLSCEKTEEPPYGEGNGNLIVYTDLAGENISLSVNGEPWGKLDSTNKILPGQGSEGGIRKTLPWGLYNYEAYSADSFRHWKGQIVVQEDELHTIKLSDLSPSLVDGLESLGRVRKGYDSLNCLYTHSESLGLVTKTREPSNSDTIKLTFNKQVLVNNEVYNPAIQKLDLSDLKLRKGRNELSWEVIGSDWTPGPQLQISAYLSDKTFIKSKVIPKGNKVQLVIVRY